MERVGWQKWWRRVNIKWLYLIFRQYCFFISNLWNEREKHINTYYVVTGWMLCVIPQIMVVVFKMHKINIIFRWILLSRVCFLDQLEKNYMKLSIRYGVNIKISIIRMILLKVMNLYGTVKISVMATFIYGV